MFASYKFKKKNQFDPFGLSKVFPDWREHRLLSFIHITAHTENFHNVKQKTPNKGEEETLHVYKH